MEDVFIHLDNHGTVCVINVIVKKQLLRYIPLSNDKH